MIKEISQFSKTISPHILMLAIMFLMYVLLFVPLLVVVYERPNFLSPVAMQNIGALSFGAGIREVVGCTVVHVETANRFIETFYRASDGIITGLFVYPLAIWLWNYLRFCRPFFFQGILFLATFFVLPFILALVFIETHPLLFCDPTPVIEIVSMRLFMPAWLIWGVMWLLAVMLNRNINQLRREEELLV